MPTKAHHRSRSSVDHVLELLAALPEDEIAQLLDDFNHTTASNVPVAEAIALFDPGRPKPRRILRASSPVRRLEAELVRRNSKRISSAPQPATRMRTPSPPPSPPLLPTPQLVADTTPAEEPRKVSEETPRPPQLVFEFRQSRPMLALSPPDAFERPRTANTTCSTRSLSYKRISRPFILSPSAQAELHDLLLAYLCETPDSPTTTATPSPVTPHAGSIFSSFGPIKPEREGLGLDLLEPSPARTPDGIFGRVGRDGSDGMSGIFEIIAFH